MPDNKPMSSIVSTLVTICGITVMCFPIYVCAFEPRLPIVIAVMLGAILGAPLLVLGFRLHPSHTKDEISSRRFWPNRSESWGIIGLLVFFVCYIIPFGVLYAAVVLLPKGDAWGIAILRLTVVSLAGCGAYGWIKFAYAVIPPWFRGKLSDETMDAVVGAKPIENQGTPYEVAIRHGYLPVFALIAICIALGVIDFHSPWIGVDPNREHTRGFPMTIQWCRDNPNTVFLASLLLAFASSACYVFQIFRATKNRKHVR